MTPQLSDDPQTVVVSHENLEYEFEKVDDTTVRFRFAREDRPRGSERTDRVDLEDVPQVVMDELRTNGYTHE
jgi:hypothetical protein